MSPLIGELPNDVRAVYFTTPAAVDPRPEGFGLMVFE